MHAVFFAYQKTLKNLLNSGSAIFVDPIINLLLKIEDEERLKLVNSETLEEALQNFGNFLVKAKVIKACNIEKMNEDKYVFTVEDCVWAGHIHRTIQPKDVVCPFGLVAMALYKRYTGGTVNDKESTYYANGSETVLEPASY